MSFFKLFQFHFMLQFIQQLPYRLTGTQADVLSKYDAHSRNKVSILGTLILIPSIIWFATGFLLTYNIMQIGLSVSLIVGSTLAILVLFIERAIVMSSNVNNWVAFFRFLLAAVLAYLGSMVLDVIVFKHDIDYKLKEQAITTLDVKNQQAFSRMESQKVKLHDEIHGKGVTRKAGYAKAAASLQKQLDQSTEDYNAQKASYNEMSEILKNQQHPKYQETMRFLGYDSFLKRLHVLHQLIKEDNMMTQVFYLMLCFGFFIEILPLLMKIGMSKSAYELDIEAQCVLLASRRGRIIEQQRLYHSQNEAQKKAGGLLSNRNSLSTLL